ARLSASVRLHEKRRSGPSLGLSRKCLSFYSKEVWYAIPSPPPEAAPAPWLLAPGHTGRRCRAGLRAAGLVVAPYRGRPAPRTPGADDVATPLHYCPHLVWSRR